MKSSEGSRGFTLIEVLVALTIVVIAFMAMYGSMMYVVAATTLIQEKTIATWIAFDRITELRIAQEFPDANESTGETEMASQEWVYTITIKDTESENMKQAIVRVAPALQPDNILGEATGVLVKPPPESDGCPPGQVCE